MNWIESEGGPFVLLDHANKQKWLGVDGDEFQEVCELEDYLNRFSNDRLTCLVLGDEPLQTSFYPGESGSFSLVRWEWADSSEDIENALKQLDIGNLERIEDDMKVELDNQKYFLIDSSIPGSKAEGMEINIKKSLFCISTHRFQPNERTSMIIHHFKTR